MAIAIANNNLYHISTQASNTLLRVPDDPGVFTATTGNTIVVAYAWRNADGPADAAPTDGPNADAATVNTYTQAATYTNGDWSLSIWKAVNITGFTDGWVNGHWSPGTNSVPRLFVVELSGVDSVDTGYAAAGNSTTSPSSPGTDSTAVAGEWLIGVWVVTLNTATYGASGGSENLHTEDPTYRTAAFATAPIASAGSASIAVTTTNTTDATNALAIALKPTAATGQFARPSSDVADGSWLNESASNVNLYASIDEETASDADYIQSGANPVNDECVVGLGAISTPQAGTVTLRIRAKYV